MRALASGHTCKRTWPKERNVKYSTGFTLIELLVVVAIISLLAAILFPVFARARENARRASCLSNVHQIALGMIQYTQDYDERLPRMSICGGPSLEDGYPAPSGCGTGTYFHLWQDVIYPYVKSTQVFNCPSAPIKSYYSGYTTFYDGHYNQSINYGYNFYLNLDDSGNQVGRNLASIPQTGNTVMVAESSEYRVDPDPKCISGHLPPSWSDNDWCTTSGSNTGDPPVGRHFDRVSIAFVDGHAKSMIKNTVVTSNIYSGATSGSAYNTLKNDPVWQMWSPRFQD